MNNAGVSIPINSSTLLRVLQEKFVRHHSIKDLNLAIQNDCIRISGITGKPLPRIYVEVKVRPSDVYNRLLFFKIDSMKPINAGWLKRKIFNRPPYMKYDRDMAIINLDSIEKVKAVPFGNIQEISIKEQKVWVRLGL
ncbi:hypothetical protein [Virgibacillus doumboii]|uniref:hypothetical protein n=1 Tax=Virgibacillus doumboii TaxID=2697503 RepID=UPI0013DF53A5|nr:hypothetical protein [Virgibacillus doumboii]